MQSVIEIPGFLSDAKHAGMTEQERGEVVTHVATNPMAGSEIKGTGGARKVRIAGRGRGKSGGYRVIFFYSGPDLPIFLLNVFAKGDRVDLSQAERNVLRQELKKLVEEYLEGVLLHVKSG